MDPADGWLTDNDSYIKTHKPIPIDRIEKVTPPFTKAEADTEVPETDLQGPPSGRIKVEHVIRPERQYAVEVRVQGETVTVDGQE